MPSFNTYSEEKQPSNIYNQCVRISISCSLIKAIELTSKTNWTEIQMMRLSAVLTLKINACVSFEAHSKRD